MKKALIILTVLLALFAVSCSEAWSESDYKPSDIQEELDALPALADTMVYTPDENPIDEYFDYYFGDTALLDGITDYIYYTSASTNCAEAGVFKVKDQATADALTEAFKTRGGNLAATFENYSADDTAIAEDLETGSFDDIVWFVASNNNEEVKSVIVK